MGRVLRFLFALPLALAVTESGFARTPPRVERPAQPPVADSRGEKAVTEPPELEIDEEDEPKLYLDFRSVRSGGEPISREAPVYPENCRATAKPEQVSLEFDITPEGVTTNIRVVDSTNSCLNKAAIAAVERWTYEPNFVDGEPAWRRDCQTRISFERAEP